MSDPVRWNRPMRAINSKNCSGYEGIVIGLISAWCDWKREEVESAVEAWIKDGGLESVKDKVERNVGHAMLDKRYSLIERFWRHVAEDQLAHRMFRMAAIAQSEAQVHNLLEEQHLAEGLPFVKDLATNLLADRLGRLIIQHRAFAARWKAIQKERRNQQVVNKVHSL